MIQGLRFFLGPALLIGLVPYLFWRNYAGIYSLAEAHRASLILSVLLTALMIISAKAVLGRRNAHLLGIIIASIALLIYGNNFLSILILFFLLIFAFSDRDEGYKRMSLFSIVLGMGMFASLYPIFVLEYGPRQIIPASSKLPEPVAFIKTPSIIHIVLDGYGASDVLADIYEHDNTPFVSTLEERGFVVMPRVFTPFNQTLFVMASVMSAGYVQPSNSNLENRNIRFDLGYTASNGWVQRQMRAADYNYAYSESGYAVLDLENATSVPSRIFELTGLEAKLLNLIPQVSALYQNRTIAAALRPDNFLTQSPPYYYYQHMLAPHPPFTVTSEGEVRPTQKTFILDGSHFGTKDPLIRAQYIDGYSEKISYIETALLDQLASVPTSEPIIVIIHGDHGPGAYFDHESYEISCIRERMTTFLAVYSNIPEVRKAFAEYAESDFNLVNIYRVIFSAISDVDIPLLPNRNSFVNFSSLTNSTNLTEEMFEQECGQ